MLAKVNNATTAQKTPACTHYNTHTCAQDGLISGAKQLQRQIIKKEVYKATLPAEGDTKVGTIVNYACSIGIQMRDVKAKGTLDTSIFTMKGGPEFAIPNQLGVFFIELLIALTGKPSDKHVVVFNSAYTFAEFPQCRGIIIDNDAKAPLKHLKPKDRENIKDGRKVFGSFFPAPTASVSLERG